MAHSIVDPFFNEFVFDCIVRAPGEARARLPYDLYKWAQTAAKAKQFSDSARLEVKLRMLTELGYAFALWVAPPEGLNYHTLLQTAEEYRDNRRADSIKKHLEGKNFVFTDREMMTMLVMMAQNCHSETYLINRDYHHLSNQVLEASRLELNTVEAARPALGDYKLLLKFVLSLLLNPEHVSGSTGFKPLELGVMIYLFLHRNAYAEQSALLDALGSQFKRAAILSALVRLRRGAYIDRCPASKKLILTGLGMHVLGCYLTRLTHLTFHF